MKNEYITALKRIKKILYKRLTVAKNFYKMDFIAIFDFSHEGTIKGNFTGIINPTIQTCLETKTKEYLINQSAPDCKIEFNTEADHIPHVNITGLDKEHTMPLTEILNNCLK